jgi:hypothetical protein
VTAGTTRDEVGDRPGVSNAAVKPGRDRLGRSSVDGRLLGRLRGSARAGGFGRFDDFGFGRFPALVSRTVVI